MVRKLLLLSGGIGAGKSAAAELLAERGALVIEADLVGHGVLEVGGDAHEAVARAFPMAVVDGVIDRALLAREVFADPARLRLLESLTHPAIRASIHRMVETSDAEVVVVEVPLLSDFLGDGWQRIVVDAPEDVRLQRLVDRGMQPLDVKTRMLAQPSDVEWVESADYLIDNSGDREALAAQIDALWKQLTAES